ncbi:transposase, Mutator family domain protein [Burkholderia multivorans]|nr:transposase, Mutator family domain protein [Burkholderia multivorans]
MPRKRKEEVTIEPGKGLNLDPELIKQLVPGTLDRATINEQLAALKKAIFERALGGELTHHFGMDGYPGAATIVEPIRTFVCEA